jgi:hypothetical protein
MCEVYLVSREEDCSETVHLASKDRRWRTMAKENKSVRRGETGRRPVSGDGDERTHRTVPSSVERVPAHTAADVNEKIRRRTEQDIAYFGSAGAQAIERRLDELDREWDIERLLEANAAGAMLMGLSFAAVFNRKWIVLPAVVGGFLLQHAIQGWCPPMGLFRRLGVRTAQEIELERYALKAIRGDFKNVGEQATLTPADADRLLKFVEA